MADVRVTVDLAEIRRQMDRATDGAVSSFVNRAEGELNTIRLGAEARWPSRSGRSRGGFYVQTSITKDRISVSMLNREKYAYYVRWSVRTSESIRDELADMRRLYVQARPGIAMALAARWGRQPTETEISAQHEADIDRRAKWLTKTHGDGAPDSRVAGRSAWNTLVMAPGRKASKRLADELRADLDRLAGSLNG